MTAIGARLARLEADSSGNDLRSVVRRAAAAEAIDPAWLLAEAERVLAEVEESGETAEAIYARERGCSVEEARDAIAATAARWAATR